MGEINKLIGRDFVVGFFMPALLFVALSTPMFAVSRKLPPVFVIDPADPLKETTFLALITLAAAFFLMAINRVLFRALEGYWPFGLERRLNFFQLRRFRRLKRRIAELDTERDECQLKTKHSREGRDASP